MTDRELLAQYARSGSDEAVSRLVERHTPLVYSTCLRVLGDSGAADDAAQAVFLVLVRKAREVARYGSLAGWLFRTAENVSRRMRQKRARRARHESEAGVMRKTEQAESQWRKLRPEVDGALAKLPRKQRDALVLRYFAGRSEAEAAAELGCPRTTLATRVSSGLARLRSVLGRRGVAVPAAALAGVLARNSVESVPAEVAVAIAAACTGMATASGAAAAAAEEVMKMMSWAKMKAAAAAFCALALVGGAGAAAMRSGAGPDKPPSAGPAAVLAAPIGHALDAVKPGHWFEVPDSHLERVGFKWPAGVKYTNNSIGLPGVMNAWSGGAYDSKRDRLIVWGGGHAAYAGNELYAFDVKKLRWQRLTDPSLQTDPEGKLELTDMYADGLPRARHTYDYIEYVPGIDRFCSFGRGGTFPAYYRGASRTNPKKNWTWTFNFETKKWKKSGVPWGVHSSALDPITGRVWVRSRHVPYIAEWNPAKKAWAVRSKRLSGNDCWAVSTIDPLGRKMYTIGHNYFWGYDIAAKGMVAQEDIKSTGTQEIVKLKMGPGVEYDPVLDKFVCWIRGTDVFALDLEKFEWKKIPAAAGNKTVPAAPYKNGTWGRWRYVPSMNAYILVSSVKKNVFFYRLSDRATAQIPKRFAETIKTGKDAKLVAWVAAQVAKWPKKKSEPVLKAGLAAQSGPAAEAIRKAIASLK